MMLYRPVQENDLQALSDLSLKSGIGITTFPKDRSMLIKRLHKACDSFLHKSNPDRSSSYYWFMLEDTATHTPIGVSAIETPIGITDPFYSFKRTTEIHHASSLQLTRKHDLLTLSLDLANSSELCTLFVDPTYRKSGYGRFLSLARFLFIAQFPQQFESRFIADLRGISNARGQSPFWQAIGKHFFPFSFKKADEFTLLTDKQFIADLMPNYPLYIDLLPPSVQAVIGQPHPLTQPAMHLLLHEGFKQGAYLDVFDAGPTLEANINALLSMKKSQLFSVIIQPKEPDGPLTMVANTHFQQFRATLAPIKFMPEHASVCLSKHVATGLHIEPGELVRIKLE